MFECTVTVCLLFQPLQCYAECVCVCVGGGGGDMRRVEGYGGRGNETSAICELHLALVTG